MVTEAPSPTSKPARDAPLTREFAEPFARVTFAKERGPIAKAQPYSSPLASILARERDVRNLGFEHLDTIALGLLNAVAHGDGQGDGPSGS